MTQFDRWRTSSYTDSGSAQCVEVGLAPGLVGIRDTKDRKRGHLEVSRTAWTTFVRSVRR